MTKETLSEKFNLVTENCTTELQLVRSQFRLVNNFTFETISSPEVNEKETDFDTIVIPRRFQLLYNLPEAVQVQTTNHAIILGFDQILNFPQILDVDKESGVMVARSQIDGQILVARTSGSSVSSENVSTDSIYVSQDKDFSPPPSSPQSPPPPPSHASPSNQINFPQKSSKTNGSSDMTQMNVRERIGAEKLAISPPPGFITDKKISKMQLQNIRQIMCDTSEHCVECPVPITPPSSPPPRPTSPRPVSPAPLRPLAPAAATKVNSKALLKVNWCSSTLDICLALW